MAAIESGTGPDGERDHGEEDRSRRQVAGDRPRPGSLARTQVGWSRLIACDASRRADAAAGAAARAGGGAAAGGRRHGQGSVGGSGSAGTSAARLGRIGRRPDGPPDDAGKGRRSAA